MLPTKGLTLPFFSYGGSSLMMCSVMVAIIYRVEQEIHFQTKQVVDISHTKLKKSTQ
jgi:cell division protein FtsW (lipid II flippase)